MASGGTIRDHFARYGRQRAPSDEALVRPASATNSNEGRSRLRSYDPHWNSANFSGPSIRSQLAEAASRSTSANATRTSQRSDPGWLSSISSSSASPIPPHATTAFSSNSDPSSVLEIPSASISALGGAEQEALKALVGAADALHLAGRYQAENDVGGLGRRYSGLMTWSEGVRRWSIIRDDRLVSRFSNSS